MKLQLVQRALLECTNILHGNELAFAYYRRAVTDPLDSGKLWDEMKTVRPSALTSWIKQLNTYCFSGSRPLRGSSMIISSACA